MSQCDNKYSAENPLEQVRLLSAELAQHPEKDLAGEVFRVLRPGGRVQIADMVRDPSSEDSACCRGEQYWADCVSGALDPGTFLSMLSKAGFLNVELAGFTDYRTATSTTGALLKAIKPG